MAISKRTFSCLGLRHAWLTLKVLRCSPTLSGNPLHYLPRSHWIRNQCRVHLGGDITGRNAVDFDTSTGPLVGECFSETKYTVLGSSVGGDRQATCLRSDETVLELPGLEINRSAPYGPWNETKLATLMMDPLPRG
jgi:hypothetical protein